MITRQRPTKQVYREPTFGEKLAAKRKLERAVQERNLAAADVRFPKQAKKLLTAWLERLDAAGDAPVSTLTAEHPNDWMRRMSYRLIRRYVQQFPTVIPDLLEGLDKRHMRGWDISDNPFKEALLLLHASPAVRPREYKTANGAWSIVGELPNLISDRRRRAELADAMLYAHRHDVPSKNFNGFRKHVGPERIRIGLAEGLREPGFSKTKA